LSQIAKSSFIVTVFTALGLGLSFLSNVVIAAKFGAGKDMDVFLAATTLPLFITSILSGSLNFTFIPVFAEYRAKEPNEIWKVVSSFINLNVVITTVLCLIGIILAYPIMKAITPGFTEEKVVKSAELLRLLFPIIIFTVINELMSSVYYSNQRFVIPSLNKIISPVLTMTYVFLFHDSLSTKSIVCAMLSAVFIQMIALAGGFFKTHDFNYSFILDYKHPGVVKIIKLMLPLILGMFIYRAIPIFDRYFLSMLQEGSISHIGYAMKLMSVIPPIIVSGISVSIFPVMSKYAAEKNWDGLKTIMSKGIRMIFFLSIPFVFFLGIYGIPVVRFVFERGAFNASDTLAVYRAFAIYLLAIPGMAMGSVIGQGYYVLQDTKTPTILGVLEVIIYFTTCILLIPKINYLAIPAAYVIYFTFALILNGFIVRHKLGNKGGVKIITSAIKHVSSAAICTIVFGLAHKLTTNTLISLGMIVIMFFLYVIVSRYIFKSNEAISLLDKTHQVIKLLLRLIQIVNQRDIMVLRRYFGKDQMSNMW